MSSLSPDDLSILTDPNTAALVEAHLGDDPAALALRLKGDRRQVRLICQQIKYLQRAKTKLPSWYAARCLIPPLAFEQCSSEAAAAAKQRTGGLCIDLTGGLGVDSYYFSRGFERVVAVKRDPVLAQVARYNFERLGARNITVENTTAEEFLACFSGPPADLIYIDPARRQEGARVFRLEDCSPDVLELMPSLLEKGRRILIKLSPLFDLAEALRLFAGRLVRAEIVSVGGEVKELLIELAARAGEPVIAVRASNGNTYRFAPRDFLQGGDAGGDVSELPFLLIPDPAFYKGRLTGALSANHFPGEAMRLPAADGFVYAEHVPEDFPGRAYRILATEPYRPKALKKVLKERGIVRINLLRRNFPHRSEEIKRALAVGEGGEVWMAFTEAEGRAIVLHVEPVNERSHEKKR